MLQGEDISFQTCSTGDLTDTSDGELDRAFEQLRIQREITASIGSHVMYIPNCSMQINQVPIPITLYGIAKITRETLRRSLTSDSKSIRDFVSTPRAQASKRCTSIVKTMLFLAKSRVSHAMRIAGKEPILTHAQQDKANSILNKGIPKPLAAVLSLIGNINSNGGCAYPVLATLSSKAFSGNPIFKLDEDLKRRLSLAVSMDPHAIAELIECHGRINKHLLTSEAIAGLKELWNPAFHTKEDENELILSHQANAVWKQPPDSDDFQVFGEFSDMHFDLRTPKRWGSLAQTYVLADVRHEPRNIYSISQPDTELAILAAAAPMAVDLLSEAQSFYTGQIIRPRDYTVDSRQAVDSFFGGLDTMRI